MNSNAFWFGFPVVDVLWGGDGDVCYVFMNVCEKSPSLFMRSISSVRCVVPDVRCLVLRYSLDS